MISFVVVFVVSVILMIRNFRMIGGVAIIAEIIQFIVAIMFLAGA